MREIHNVDGLRGPLAEGQKYYTDHSDLSFSGGFVHGFSCWFLLKVSSKFFDELLQISVGLVYKNP